MSGEEMLTLYFPSENEVDCKNFVGLTVGYPACGYPQQNAYFSIRKGELFLVDSFSSFSDSSFGEGYTFYNFCNNHGTQLISSIKVQSDPDESNQEAIVSKFSDSAVYRFEGEKWTEPLMSEKGKILHTERFVL
jgi:hypothetical protein